MRKTAPKKKPVSSVLSIAASDSIAGAGIQADIRACQALVVYCTTAITAVTAQNTMEVERVHPMPPSLVLDQIDAICADYYPDAIKIGMLPNVGVASAVADFVESLEGSVPIIVDPVIVSSSGKKLASKGVLEIICDRIAPNSMIMTPNIPEVKVISRYLKCLPDGKEVARRLNCLLLVKGGHMQGDVLDDHLYDSESKICSFRHSRINTENTHGTGCSLSSMIAASLAVNSNIPKAIAVATSNLWDNMLINSHNKYGKGGGPAYFESIRIK